MKLSFNNYMKGKELFKETLPLNENEELYDINERYNEYLKQNNYSIDNLVLEKGNLIKRYIGRKIIQNNAKKYANAYRDWKFIDVEIRREKLDKKWSDLDKHQKEKIIERWGIKKDAAKDKLDAIVDRMDTIAKSYGVEEYAKDARSKAKLEAVEEVMKHAEKVFTESQKEALEEEHKNIKKAEEEAKKARIKAEKEEEKIKNKTEAMQDEGWVSVKKDEEVDEDKWEIVDVGDKKMKKKIDTDKKEK